MPAEDLPMAFGNVC